MGGPSRSVAILGLGLIGGSVARALARAGGWRVVAWSRSREAVERAAADGVIDEVAADPMTAAASAPLVLLATPVPVILGTLRELGPGLAAGGAVVTDVGSSKSLVMAAAARVPGLRFVGGHPMSGAETAGYGASRASLFDERPWVVVPGAMYREEDVAAVGDLARACGAWPVELDAAAHDRAVAAISHLPLVASLALAEAALEGADWTAARQLAAQGWRDMTRLARGDPAMGGGMLATNAAAVAERLRDLRAALDEWQVRVDALAAATAPEGAAGDAAGAAELTARLRAIAERLAGP